MTNKAPQQGFTIIETLIAVLLLSTAIAGPLTIASKSLTTALAAKDQLTAFYLAQDAVEYIRYARDTNKLSGDNWLTGAGGSTAGVDVSSCEGASGCQLDSRGIGVLDGIIGHASVAACSGACPAMLFDSTSGAYNYITGSTAGTPSLVRTVTITNPDGTTFSGGSEAKLSVVVAWREPGGPRSVTVTEEIFNWQ